MEQVKENKEKQMEMDLQGKWSCFGSTRGESSTSESAMALKVKCPFGLILIRRRNSTTNTTTISSIGRWVYVPSSQKNRSNSLYPIVLLNWSAQTPHLLFIFFRQQ